uniref:Uncharacterized protein n=1 Tax=Arundo donax TaxID=35708 RepID=A0A0A9BVQ9_ARUDO
MGVLGFKTAMSSDILWWCPRSELITSLPCFLMSCCWLNTAV